MFFLLLASCIVIFIFFETKEQAERKYPRVEDCSELYGAKDDEYMQKTAIIDYLSNSALEKDGRVVSYT